MTIVTSLVTIQNTQIITYHTIWPNKSSYLCPGFPIVGGGHPPPPHPGFFFESPPSKLMPLLGHPPPLLKMKLPHLKNNLPTLKREAPFHEMISKKKHNK